MKQLLCNNPLVFAEECLAGMPENRRTPQNTTKHHKTPQNTAEHRRTLLKRPQDTPKNNLGL